MPPASSRRRASTSARTGWRSRSDNCVSSTRHKSWRWLHPALTRSSFSCSTWNADSVALQQRAPVMCSVRWQHRGLLALMTLTAELRGRWLTCLLPFSVATSCYLYPCATHTYNCQTCAMFLSGGEEEILSELLCAGLCDAMFTVSSTLHTYMSSSYRCSRLGLSHWDPYAVHRGGCLELYYCNMVESSWWDSSLICKTNWLPSVL